MKHKDLALKIIKENKLNLILIIFLFIINLIIKHNFMDKMNWLDYKVFEFIKVNLKSEYMTIIMKFITHFGDFIAFGIIIIFSFIFINKKLSLLLSLSLFSTFILNKILKFIYLRKRPLTQIVLESGYSMPSGHAMCSIAFYGFLLNYVKKHPHNNKFLCILSAFLLILVLAIGFSRIYLNVHYFSDVVMGYMFGYMYLLIFIKISDIISKQEEKE